MNENHIQTNIIIEIDNCEKLTPSIAQAVKDVHPKMYRGVELKFQENLPTFDLRCETTKLGVEFKHGSDAISSLNNGQLERELIQMVAWAQTHPGYRLHAIMSSVDMSHLSDDRLFLAVDKLFTTYKRFVALCLQYGVIPHHRNSPQESVELAFGLAIRTEDPEKCQPLNAPKINKFTGLGPALCQLVDGLSIEFAQYVVELHDAQTMKDLVDLTEGEWLNAGLCYYNMEMGELCSKIYLALNGLGDDE